MPTHPPKPRRFLATQRGIREWFWLYQDGKLGYLQDADGDENFHCFSVDIETKIVRDLSPFQVS